MVSMGNDAMGSARFPRALATNGRLSFTGNRKLSKTVHSVEVVVGDTFLSPP